MRKESMIYGVVLFGQAFNLGVELGCMAECKNACLQLVISALIWAVAKKMYFKGSTL